MRKQVLLAVVLLLACAAGAAYFLRAADAPAADVEPIAPVEERDFMRVSLIYDAGTRTLRGTQTLTATNRTSARLDDIVLRLYMNGAADAAVTVSGVTANGETAAYMQNEDDPTVLRIARGWEAGETVELSWTVMLKHPKAEGAALITLPSLAMAENGAWRTDAYDALAEPSYAQAFDYSIDLIAKDDARAAFGGRLIASRWETGVGETLYIAQLRGARDVSFALMDQGKARQKEIGGVLVTALAQDAKTAKTLLSSARQALESLEAVGLPYPFDTLTVAQSGMAGADGMALSGLIALDTDEDGELLLRRITRLIARETFGIRIENDPWDAPWLSVSLASCAEMLAYRIRKGEDAYLTRLYEELEVASYVTRPGGVSVGASTAHFGSESEMMQVLRDQGAAMLLGIEQAVGQEKFVRALQLYAQQNAGAAGTLESLASALQSATGSAWDGYLLDGLSF